MVCNFHVIFFLIWRAAPFVFLCRSMPSASLMTLNLSRSIGTRARRHAHTATNTCNTATHTCNTPTHLENSSTTQHNNPAACMPLYTPLRAHAHTGLNCCTHQGEKRPQKKRKASDSPTSYHIYRRVDRTESQNTNRSLCLGKRDGWLWSFVTFRTVNRPTSVLRSRVIR